MCWDSKPSLSHSKTDNSSFSLTWSNNIKIKCKLELMNLQFPLTYLGFFSLLLPSPGTCICLHTCAYTHCAHVSTCTHTYNPFSKNMSYLLSDWVQISLCSSSLCPCEETSSTFIGDYGLRGVLKYDMLKWWLLVIFLKVCYTLCLLEMPSSGHMICSAD